MYKITERTNRNVPASDDRLARAFKCQSGVYDLRDTLADNVIVASSTNLTAMRGFQAKCNTVRLLDAPAHELDHDTIRALMKRTMRF